MYETLWQESLDADGRAAFVKGCLPMAYKLAYKYARRTLMDHEEIVSAALMGLVRAAHAFDPSRGFAATTYAHYAIERAIWTEIARMRAKGLGGCASGKPRFPVPEIESIGEVRESSLSTFDADMSEADDQRYRVVQMLRLIKDRRARAMVRARFLRGMTLDECGKKFGVTKERVRQIVLKAVNVMRRSCGV